MSQHRLKVLVIGCGGREHAIIKSLLSSRFEPLLYCYGNYKNPGILPLVKAYGNSCNNTDFEDIVTFAKKFNVDFAIIGPENPLVQGIANELERNDIRCIGPYKEYAQLEGSKAYTRILLEKYGLSKFNPIWKEWSPKPIVQDKRDGETGWSPMKSILGYEELKKNKFFHIESDIRNHINFLENTGVVIKSDGLKGGKGVKVQGSHFETAQQGMEWCKQLYNQKERFIIEEKLVGEEFSLISFCDGKNIVHSPPVRDYKRVFNNDLGPNCGGMGSVTSLNFLSNSDIETAQSVNKSVMKALMYDINKNHKTCIDRGYVGFLYGSFIKLTKDSQNGSKGDIKVIEYNVRLGDPECINLLGIMETDFMELCMAMLNQSLDEINLKFSSQPSKCVYFVPKGYPVNSGKDLEVDMTFVDVLYENGIDVFIAGMKTKESNQLTPMPISSNIIIGRNFLPTHSNMHAVQYSSIQTYRGITINDTNVGVSDVLLNYKDKVQLVRDVVDTSSVASEDSGDVIIDMEISPVEQPIEPSTEQQLENNNTKIVLSTTGSRAIAVLAVTQEQIDCLDSILNDFKDNNVSKNLYFRTDIGDGLMKTVQRTNTPVPGESSRSSSSTSTPILGESSRSSSSTSTSNKITYKDSGVDIDEGNLAVSNIQQYARSTYNKLVVDNPGGFGGMMRVYDNIPSPILVASTDSVGSKSEFVKAFSKKSKAEIYENLGHDIVNHCVNDILVQSPETRPLYFLDYFATHSLNRDVFEPFVKGVSAACKLYGCVLIGGETAEIPAIYREDAVDLVGSITGVIDDASDVLKPKETIKAGDLVYAMRSVSPHTNGFTLLKCLVENAIANGDDSYLEFVDDWCKPHKCYLKDIRTLSQSVYGSVFDIRGLCHITGGGLVDNPIRILPTNCTIDWYAPALEDIIRTTPWMTWIAERIDKEEYTRVFNCGIGMLIVVSNPKGMTEETFNNYKNLILVGHIKEK